MMGVIKQNFVVEMVCTYLLVWAVVTFAYVQQVVLHNKSVLVNWYSIQ